MTHGTSYRRVGLPPRNSGLDYLKSHAVCKGRLNQIRQLYLSLICHKNVIQTTTDSYEEKQIQSIVHNRQGTWNTRKYHIKHGRHPKEVNVVGMGQTNKRLSPRTQLSVSRVKPNVNFDLFDFSDRTSTLANPRLSKLRSKHKLILCHKHTYFNPNHPKHVELMSKWSLRIDSLRFWTFIVARTKVIHVFVAHHTNC